MICHRIETLPDSGRSEEVAVADAVERFVVAVVGGGAVVSPETHVVAAPVMVM